MTSIHVAYDQAYSRTQKDEIVTVAGSQSEQRASASTTTQAQPTENERLIEALGARDGIVCMVGAGGKKSAMYRLCELHPGRVAVTTSVHIPPFPDDLNAAAIVTHASKLEAAVLASNGSGNLAYACRSEKPGRYGGVDPHTIARLHAELDVDLTVVKADGARRRLVKGPGGRDPIIPPTTATVLVSVSVQVVNQPLDARTAHYVEAITELTNVKPGKILRPDHVATLVLNSLSADWLPSDARVIPMLNMVDDEHLRSPAEQTAMEILSRGPQITQVVATSMTSADPLVDVYQR